MKADWNRACKWMKKDGNRANGRESSERVGNDEEASLESSTPLNLAPGHFLNWPLLSV